MTGWPGSGRPAHAARPKRPPIRWGTAVAGGTVLLAALGLAAAAVLTNSVPTRSTPTSASLITVNPVIDKPGDGVGPTP